MPIYEYRCLECGEKFEKLVRSMNSAPELGFPKRAGRKLKKPASAFRLRISGSASQPVCATSVPRG